MWLRKFPVEDCDLQIYKMVHLSVKIILDYFISQIGSDLSVGS